MSGLILLVGCLAVVALLAAPSALRAATRGSAAPVAARALTNELVAPIYMNYATIKGEIAPAPESKFNFLKADLNACKSLVVHAMRKAGGEQSKPETMMRKAGGDLSEVLANAVPGPSGSCSYSMKLPVDGSTWQFSLKSASFKPAPSQDEAALMKYAKAQGAEIGDIKGESHDYKLHKGEGAYYLKYGGAYDKWMPAAAGDGIWIKGTASQTIKLDGKSSAVPTIFFTGGV